MTLSERLTALASRREYEGIYTDADIAFQARDMLERLRTIAIDIMAFVDSPVVTIDVRGRDNYGETKGQWDSTIRDLREAVADLK